MRLVTLRGAWAAVAWLAEIGPRLHRALRRLAARGIANTAGQRGHVRRDVEHDPVPPAAAGWRVGVVNGDCEALRASRSVLPGERRRDVASVAPKSLEDVRVRDRRI